MGDEKLTWDNAPETLDSDMLGELLSARPVWVRKHLKHLATRLGSRMLRWRKQDVLAYLEEQRVNAA